MTGIISKTPEVSLKLDGHLKDLLTELCFRSEIKFKDSDLAFVFGTPFFFEQTATIIDNLIETNAVGKVLLTGGIVPHGKPSQLQKSEARLIYEEVKLKDQASFYLEEKSTNTLENVVKGMNVLNFKEVENICFVFPSHGAMRGYLTLRRFLPQCNLFQCTYDAMYPGESSSVSKDNWHQSECGIKRVWGEYLRIKQYGIKGDIAYTEVRGLIEKINNRVT